MGRMKTTDTLDTMSRTELLAALSDGRRAGDATLEDFQAEIEEYEAWLDDQARLDQVEQIETIETQCKRISREIVQASRELMELESAIFLAGKKKKVARQAIIPPGLSMFTRVKPLPARTIKHRVLILERWIEGRQK